MEHVSSLASLSSSLPVPLTVCPRGWPEVRVPAQHYGVHAAGTAPGRAVAAESVLGCVWGWVLIPWRGCGAL